MTVELNMRTLEHAGEIDANTMYELIYLTKHLPYDSELNGGTHDDIRASIQALVGDESSRSVVVIAEELPLGRPVGYIATQVNPGRPEVAEVTQLAIAPTTSQAKEVGNLLIQEAVSWGENHEVSTIIPKTVEFTGRVVGREVVAIGTGSVGRGVHPSTFLG